MGVATGWAAGGVTGWQQQVLAASVIVEGDRSRGSGVLVDSRHLLTAAHVVATKTDTGWVISDSPFTVRFPGGSVTVGPSQIVVPGTRDVAIVDLGEQPPAWLPEPVRLSPARRLPGRVELMAYPGADQTKEGAWRAFAPAGPTASGQVQLRWIENAGSLAGQSGGPVVNADTGDLVGLLLSSWDPTFGDGRFDRVLPVREIVAAWPELARRLPWLFAGQDARAHVTRRAYGQRSRSRGGDLFRGRGAALGKIAEWLTSDPAPGQVLVVTGQPGAGKSAVVGRAALAAEQAHPGAGLVFHARGATLADLSDAVAALIGAPTSAGSGSLVDLVAASGLSRPLMVVVDALDEAAASEERHAMAALLTELAGLPSCRVVVATRPLVAGDAFNRDGMLSKLGVATATAGNLIDLDGAYADSHAVEEFARALLAQEGAENPGPPTGAWRVYRAQPVERDRLAHVIAGRADHNFLVAALTAVPLSEQPEPLEADAAGFDPRQLPSSVEEALCKFLDTLPARDRARIHALLKALAHAKGSGITDSLWLQFAQALDYDVSQLDLDELRASTAVDFLLQTTSDTGGHRTRLFHQALVDQFLPAGRDRHRDRAILTRLRDRVRAQGGWSLAEPYLLAHTAEHALDAGQLPALLDDPGFLAHAHLTRLVAAVTSLPQDQHTPAVLVVLRASDRARDLPPQQRAALFALTAAHLGLTDVRDALQTEAGQQLTPTWAHALGQPHQVLTGHNDSVLAVALGALGGHSVLVSGASDGEVRVWDEHGRPVGRPLLGHDRAVSAVAVGRLGERDVIVTASHDHTLRVWDEQGSPVGAPLLGHPSAVTSVAIGRLAGRDVVVSGDSDGTLRVWDERGDRVGDPLRAHTRGVTAVRIGRLDGHEVVVSGGIDGLVRVWERGHPVAASFTGHDGAVTAVAIGRLGTRDVVVSGGSDGTVRVWDERGRPIGDPFTGHVGAVTAVAIGQVGHRHVVASGGWDRTVRLWDDEGRPFGLPLTGHTSAVYAVAFGQLANRNVIASGGRDRTIRVWEHHVAVGQPLAGHAAGVTSVATGRLDGRDVIVSGSWDRTVRLWDDRGQPVGDPLIGHNGAVYAVAIGCVSGLDVIVSGSDDQTMRIWNERGVQVEPLLASPESAPVRADRAGHILQVVDADVGEQRLSAPDDWRGTQPGAVIVRLFGNPDNIDVTRQYPGPVYAVAVGRLGGRDAIVSGNDDQTIRIWDERGDPVAPPLNGHLRSVRSVAVGRVGGHDVIVSGSRDQSVQIWDDRGHPVGQPLLGHTGAVHTVAIGRLDGRDVIVSGSDDRTIRVWDERGHPVGAPLVGHLGAVTAVAVGRLRDRDVIVSGSSDRTIRVWDEELRPLGGPYPFLDSVTALAFHRLGLVVAAGPALILMAPDAR